MKSLFIDGTKIEANANRYTFVWRGTTNYHLAGLLDMIDSLYQKYNVLIDENEYGIKYAASITYQNITYKVTAVSAKALKGK